MKKLLILTTCCLGLTGCVPAVFVAGAAGGVAVNDNRTLSTKWEDQRIANDVRQQLHANPNIYYDASVSVAVFNYNVLLTGNVPDEELHQTALEITKAQRGVKRVHDHLNIARPISVSQAANDTWITTKIKSLMLAEKDLNSSQIKVVTNKGHVYLLGLVTRRQADLATNVVRHVPGVRKVVKLFEYL